MDCSNNKQLLETKLQPDSFTVLVWNGILKRNLQTVGDLWYAFTDYYGQYQDELGRKSEREIRSFLEEKDLPTDIKTVLPVEKEIAAKAPLGVN